VGRFAHRVVMFAILGVVLMGCRVQGQVQVDVAANGSGTVTVGVGLDADAVTQVGDLSTALKTSDLAAAGWKVAKAHKSGALTWVRATKPFRSPADLGRVMGEIGLFPSWHLTVSNGFGATTWKVAGKIVSAGTIDQFSDSTLKSTLDGLPVGLTPAQEAADLKASGPIPLTVQVHLPAETAGTTTYTVDVAGAPAVTRTVAATASRTDGSVLRWFVIAGLLFAVGLVLAVIGRLRGDRRDQPVGRHARP
jgi:hypothetical protein